MTAFSPRSTQISGNCSAISSNSIKSTGSGYLYEPATNVSGAGIGTESRIQSLDVILYDAPEGNGESKKGDDDDPKASFHGCTPAGVSRAASVIILLHGWDTGNRLTQQGVAGL
jgi:hypothetical protein